MTELMAALVTALPLMLGWFAACRHRRRDRSVATQELDILDRLDPDSAEAGYVRELLARRVRRWSRVETSKTSQPLAVVLGCLSGLYGLAIGGWALGYSHRRLDLEHAEALSRGDSSSVAHLHLQLEEMSAVASVLTVLIYLVLGVCLLHTVILVLRFVPEYKRWSLPPDVTPGHDLLGASRPRESPPRPDPEPTLQPTGLPSES